MQLQKRLFITALLLILASSTVDAAFADWFTGFAFFSDKITTKYSCRDSDSGKNQYVYGTVFLNITKSNWFGKPISTIKKYSDSCKKNVLTEYFCYNQSTSHLSAAYDCAFGCKKGACFYNSTK